jgi:2-methylisocitrate lyase-like PEP mutase family enzyme
MTYRLRAQGDQAQFLRKLRQDPELLELVNVWDVASAQVIARTSGCGRYRHSLGCDRGSRSVWDCRGCRQGQPRASSAAP